MQGRPTYTEAILSSLVSPIGMSSFVQVNGLIHSVNIQETMREILTYHRSFVYMMGREGTPSLCALQHTRRSDVR